MSDALYSALMRAYEKSPDRTAIDEITDALQYMGPQAPNASVIGIIRGLMQQKAKDELLQRVIARGGEVPAISGQTSLRADREDRPDLGAMQQGARIFLARMLPKFFFSKVGGVPTFFPGGR